MLFTECFLTILTIIGVFFLLNCIRFYAKNYVQLSKLPGPPRQGIFIGNLAFLQTTPENLFLRINEATRKYFPIFQLSALHKLGVVIVSPEDVELVVSNPKHNTKGFYYDLLHNWLNDGLLTSSGNKWQTRRKILTPAFHFNILQQFLQVFHEESRKLVSILREECDQPYVNVTSHITQFTLKTIAATAMGTNLDFQNKTDNNYKQAVNDIGEILLYRFLHPWFIFKIVNIFSPLYLLERKVLKILHNFTREVIKKRKSNFNDSELSNEEHNIYRGKKRLAMLDLLLCAKRNDGIIDDNGIQEEVDTFMFEGHDTTAAALSLTLMLLACHKNSQDIIFQEVQDILGDIHKKPSYHDLQNMKYLERCIKESLRLYPSVFFIARTLGEDVKAHSGYLLPKETIVTIYIYAIHHNPDIYPDPEKFNPDRFLPENSKDRHPFAYLPFSAGPRNCIGQKFAILELKVVICAILANFILEPVDTPESVVLMADIILRTKEGVKVKFVSRR